MPERMPIALFLCRPAASSSRRTSSRVSGSTSDFVSRGGLSSFEDRNRIEHRGVGGPDVKKLFIHVRTATAIFENLESLCRPQ